MAQYELALQKSIASGNTDLIYLTLFDLRAKKPSDFFRMVNGSPTACALLEVYAKAQNDMVLLTDFYEQDDRRTSLANLKVSKALSNSVICDLI